MARGGGRKGARVGAAAALLAVSLGACEGGHLFQGATVGPEITNLNVPLAVESGSPLEVAIRALGTIRVDSIVATFRVGDFEETQVARQTGILSDYSAGFEFSIPAIVTDTLGTLEAFAVDAQQNVGTQSSVTIRTIDTTPPSATASVAGSQIGVGAQIEVVVTATDNIGLKRVGFRLVDPLGEVLDEILVAATGTEVERPILYTVGSDLPLGPASIVAVAVDHGDLESTGIPLSVALVDIDLPEVEVLTPAGGEFLPAQMSLFSRVRLNDNDAVDSVVVDAVSHRGSRTLGTDTVVGRFNPVTVRFDPAIADTILQRFLTPTADSSAENAFVRAVAYDREGNVSRDSVEVTLEIDDVAPFVELREPVEGHVEGIGDSILVRTFVRELSASVRSGVQSLRLEGLAFRGDEELGTAFTVERFTPRTITFNPPVTDVNGLLVSRYLTATADATSETVSIIATATDAWGNARADTVDIRVVHDTLPPTITILQPVDGQMVVAGTPILVQTQVDEPDGPDQAGVSQISIDAWSFRLSAGNTVPDRFLKYVPQNFQIVPPQPSFGQNATLVPTTDVTVEDMWIRVSTFDALGNFAIDSVRVVLTP